MSKGNVHFTVGAFAATVKTIIKCVQEFNSKQVDNPDLKFDWSNCILRCTKSYIIGGFGACLPDKLEPSKIYGPNHRQFAHSITMVIGLNYINFKMKHSDVPPLFKECLDDLVIGYNSHLILDGFTPKSLPLLGIK